MGIFRQFPYSNFHELNLDSILSIVKELDNAWDEFNVNWQKEIQDAVNKWIAGNPQAIMTGYVMPENYDAVGDGATDDYEAVKAAIDFAAANNVPVLLTKQYLISHYLDIPSNVKIFGFADNDTMPAIVLDNYCYAALHCEGVRNVFANFEIKPVSGTYQDQTTGIVCIGSGDNVDSKILGVQIQLIEKGVEVRGRNVTIKDCIFSHCAYGIDFVLTQNTQYRGLNVDTCRFHGIGEEADLNWFENSACIRIANNYWTNLTVRNCVSEQGGTFFSGYCTSGLFLGNFVESYKKDIIDISTDNLQLPGNGSALLFIGNSFNGKQGSVAPDITMPYPEHIINVNSFGRLNFIGNILRYSNSTAINLKDVTRTVINNNIFIGNDLGATGTKHAISLDTSRVFIYNNTAESDNMALYTASAASVVAQAFNLNFNPVVQDANVTITQTDSFVKYDEVTAGTQIPLSRLPHHFYARIRDNRTFFEFWHMQRYITTGVAWDADGLGFYQLTWENDGTNVTPTLRKYELEDLTNPTVNTAATIDIFVNVD